MLKRSDQKELLRHMVERIIIDPEGIIRLELRTPFAYLRDRYSTREWGELRTRHKKQKDRQRCRSFLAGRTGFEPANRYNTVNRLAGGPNRPLWHLPILDVVVPICKAEREGFEPPEGTRPSVVFKTTALNHSAIAPA